MRDETGRGPLQMWSVLVVLGLVLLAVVFPAALAVGAGVGGEDDVVRAVLTEFFNATGGAGWFSRCAQPQTGGGCWLDPATPDFCQWLGISCRPASSGNATLLSISLERNNLHGSLEGVRFDALGERLERLNLDRNELEGPVPASLCQVHSLTELRMSNNHLNGLIPDCFNNSKLLTRLDLSSNLLVGPLPESLFRVPSLEYLVLASNLINGSLPRLFGATNLTKLVLSSNRLHGKFPQDIQYLNYLVQVSLDHNQFSDTFDEDNFVPFTRIMSAIDVSHNNFSGYIPSRIASMVRGGSMSHISFASNPNMMAQGKGAPVPPYLDLLDSELTVKDRRKYYCKSVIVAEGGLLAVDVSPEYFDYHHCSCSRGFHGKPPNVCEGCPTNCQCAQGGNVLTWPPGYYPIISTDNPDKELRVVSAQKCPAADYACNPHGNCSFVWNQGILPGCALCSLGSSGRLCTKCHCRQYEECYYLNYKSQCVLCQRVARSTIVAGVVLVMFALIVVLFVWIYKREQRIAMLDFDDQYHDISGRQIGDGDDEDKDDAYGLRERIAARSDPVTPAARPHYNIHGHILNESGKLRLLILYWQVSSLLNSRWPHWAMKYGMRFLSVFDPQTTEFGLECLFPIFSDPFYDLLINFLIVPCLALVLAIAIAVCFASRYVRRLLRTRTPVGAPQQVHRPSTNDADDGSTPAAESLVARGGTARQVMWSVNVLLFILWLFYFQICNKAFAVFPCLSEPATRDSYVAAIQWLSCSSPEWQRLRTLAIVGLVVYAVGVPLLFAGLYLYFLRKKALFDPDVQYTIGFFYSGYKEHHWYEGVIFLRRFALSLLIFALPPDTPFRETGLFALLLLALSCVFLLRPYRQKLDWVLEIVSLFVLVATYIAQSEWTYLIPNYQLFDPEPDVAALVWTMLLLNLSTIIIFMLVMLFVVLRLPIFRYLRARGRTHGVAYAVVRHWDRVVQSSA